MEKKVLLVTHDQREVDNLTPALEDLGYEWKHTRDATMGMEFYEDFHPDLIILNALAPRGGALDLCRHVRHKHRDAKTKILVTSAVSTGTIQLEARIRWGADEVVLLPIPLTKMVQLVSFMLGDLDERPMIRHFADLAVRRDSPSEMKPVKKKLARSGDLSEIPLGSLLTVLVRKSMSGTLSFGENDQQRDFLIAEGRVLDVHSGYLPGMGLADVLVAQGLIDKDALGPFLEQALEEKKKLGVVLRENQLINDYALANALREQAVRKLADVFQWSEGHYQFTPGVPNVTVNEPLNLNLAKLAFRAARIAADPSTFAERFQDWLDQKITLKETAAIRPNLLDLNPDEKRFVFQLDGKRTISQVLEEKILPEPEMRSMLSALITLGMLSR
jgi:CheY-like chemotaxis protein